MVVCRLRMPAFFGTLSADFFGAKAQKEAKMSKQYNVGLVGIGAVGAEMVKVLRQRKFPAKAIQVFASRERDEVIAGETFHVLPTGVKVVDDPLNNVYPMPLDATDKYDVLAGRIRQDPEVPLVVPQVNAEDLEWHKGVIANPNCTTAIMLEAVAPLHKAKGLKRLVASTYQAASGAGAAGMAELEEQMREMVAGKPLTVKAFAHQLTNNLIPHIDKFDETNWYTLEELKMRNEARKMLHAPDLLLA